MKPKLNIILPVFNEEESIIPLIKELRKVEKKLTSKYQVFYIWVNDGSTDKSKKILSRVENQKNIVITFIKNFGKTSAISAALDKVKNGNVVILDTDLQDNPAFIKPMLELLEKDKADFVIGNRVNRYQNNLLKKISTTIVKHSIKLIFPGLEIDDINCGLKVMTSQAASNIYLKSDYHRYMPLIAHLKGFRVTQLNLHQRKRSFGESKYGQTGLIRSWKSLSDLLGIIFVFRLASNPFSFFGKLGVFTIFGGTLILLYLSILWLLGTPINSRPLFFLGILAVTTGSNFFSMGLIGDLVKMVNGEKDYLIKEKE